MSVVAWDGKTLAADRQGTLGDGSKCRLTKLWKVGEDVFCAVTGPHEQALLLLKWFKDGENPATFPHTQGEEDWARLIVLEHGKVFEIERHPIRQEVEDRFEAWGAGRELAIGAMAMGATAEEAVMVACEHNCYCGFGVISSRS